MTRGVVNWKSRSWVKLGSWTKSGQLVSFSFKKQYSNTHLRLTFTSNYRQIGNSKCAQWDLRVNQQRCSSPGPIDANLLYHTNSVPNFYFDSPRLGTITGVCKATSSGNINAGTHVISVWVGSCPYQHSPGQGLGDVLTGWSCTTSLIVEELCPPA